MAELNLPVGYIVGGNGEYQIIRRQPLSEGVSNTFAEVYLVKKTKVRKKFALKVLRPEIIARYRRSVADFQDEIRVLMDIQHKNIITIDDFGTLVDKDGMPSFYLVMPYIENGELLKEKYSAQKMLYFFMQILDGLTCLHKRNTLHRDIKPDNILVEHDSIIKIADFGIAKLIDTESPVSSVIGAPAYAPPEQLKRIGHLSCASDLYAAGKTLYTMLTKKAPEVNKPVDRLPDSLRKESWAEPVERILTNATRYDPRSRYQSAGEMRRDVAAVYKSFFQARRSEPTARTADAARRGRRLHRKTAAALIAAAVLLTAGGVALWRSTPSTDADLPAYRTALQQGINRFHDPAVPVNDVDGYFTALLRDFDADADGLFYAALTGSLDGDAGSAVRRLERAAKMAPDRTDIKIILGKILYENGNYAGARSVWRNAKKNDPHNTQINNLLKLGALIKP